MCVCMYVCVYVCVCVCMYVCMCMYVCVCAYVFVCVLCMYVCMYVCIYIFKNCLDIHICCTHIRISYNNCTVSVSKLLLYLQTVC